MKKKCAKKPKSEAEIIEINRKDFIIMDQDLSDLSDEKVKENIAKLGEIMGKSMLTVDEASIAMIVMAKSDKKLAL